MDIRPNVAVITCTPRNARANPAIAKMIPKITVSIFVKESSYRCLT